MNNDTKQRVIKFRCFYGGKMDDHAEVMRLLYNASTGYPQLTQFIPLQFTGLTDKEGKEIYEGDIIEFNESDTLKDGSYLRLIVSWIQDNQSAGWGFVDTKGNKVHLSFIHSKREQVIGNIYQNPELLKCRVSRMEHS
jgi:uncharacterized phage protein (TIGR01671 family)